MYTVFVIGNIASGKSTACRYLASMGGDYLNLDDFAKGLYEPGSDLVNEIVASFGWDVLDSDGSICRSALARKAFETPESVQVLNHIVRPYISHALQDRLLGGCQCGGFSSGFSFIVVEVSVPDNARDLFSLADDILAISAPVDVRRQRAVGRGMTLDEFDRRSCCQPSEEELVGQATEIIDNSGDAAALRQALDDFLKRHSVKVTPLTNGDNCG